MERKEFLRTFALAGLALAGLKVIDACSTDDSTTPETSGTDTSGGSGSGSGSTSGNCVVSPTETAGPFPTHNPSTLVATNIIGDRTGIPLTINIALKNTNNSCNALTDTIVDIWHCDKDGNYSEYGGSGMQSTNYTNNHFLRGRQTTNANGEVAFTSIFPGWYTGRATHIHVHVYNSAGTSLLITQIAFPESSSSAVVQVNASSANGYTKGMSGYTYNANDNVFSDDSTGAEIATVTGTVSDGFVLAHTINVAA
ncbi:intradiol ring-cleavage dioxygenase [Flavobacterium sp. Sd200]|uniref:dioxygenase family protein n=1 Tax=Flavobacterium sp. Sd200 TaxID=2692211 RepID=UPI00136AE2FE|nr:intradiol ring-cleavage dioxygenase [Flavobacterium sp. Sd200]MXN91950.1 intradiol ring-cleavage dioxygenase [Flavobacterium sp. Sd200]